MRSMTYGEIDMHQVAVKIMERVKQSPEYEFKLSVGTDSQNIGPITKIVPVILLSMVGRGAIFFYDVIKVVRINSIRAKLSKETQLSLQYADELMLEFEKLFDEFEFDYTTLNLSIHVDAGEKGETGKLMADISAWVTSCGYDCSFKPESFTASTVADKISK